MPTISFELIVVDDPHLIAEVSIARNYQNKVADLSIYGRQGRFEELEARMQEKYPGVELRKRETDFSSDYLDTEKLVQVMTALAPHEIELPSATRKNPSKETLYRV